MESLRKKMNLEKVGFKYKKKSFEFDLKVCRGLNQAIGLMFSRREKASALLFKFDKPIKLAIHSWFVFFPFIAIWFDENNKIIDLKEIRPFTHYIKPKKSFKKLIEIPMNKKYGDIIEILVSTRKI